MEDALKPCPFCGKVETVFVGTEEQIELLDYKPIETVYAICCSKLKGGCGASSGYGETKQEARDAWNRRTPDIVRCGECKNWGVTSVVYRGHSKCEVSKKHTRQNDFCSYGKRKE